MARSQGSVGTIFDFPNPVHIVSARTHREDFAAQVKG